MCGIDKGCVGENCAIALAVREIAPNAGVSPMKIFWTGALGRMTIISLLPANVTRMIFLFDKASPKERLKLPEFSFEVDFPDELVERIGIQEVKQILEKSETLEEVV